MTLKILAALYISLSIGAYAQTKTISVRVIDTDKNVVVGARIGIIGGSSQSTGDDGIVLLRYDAATTGRPLRLQVLGTKYAIFWPDAGLIDDTSLVQSKIELILQERGSANGLKNTALIASIVEQVLKSKAEHPETPPSLSKDDALKVLSQQYGYSPNQIEETIRSLAKTTDDSYQKGLFALYNGDAVEATKLLSGAAEQRQEGYLLAKETLGQRAYELTSAEFFLGQSLYAEKRFADSALAFKKILDFDPDNSMVLNNAALSSASAGDGAAALDLYKKAVTVDEVSPNRDPRRYAVSLGNYAGFIMLHGGPDDPRVLLERAMKILTDAHFGTDRRMAWVMGLHGQILTSQNDLNGALREYQQALSIFEHGTPPDLDGAANVKIDIGELLLRQGKNDDAEKIIREAMAIHASLPQVGEQDPEYATDLWFLGATLYRKGDTAGSVEALKKAYVIDLHRLGPNDMATKRIVDKLATLPGGRVTP